MDRKKLISIFFIGAFLLLIAGMTSAVGPGECGGGGSAGYITGTSVNGNQGKVTIMQEDCGQYTVYWGDGGQDPYFIGASGVGSATTKSHNYSNPAGNTYSVVIYFEQGDASADITFPDGGGDGGCTPQGPYECQNGQDDDADSKCDYPEDNDCNYTTWNNEAGPPPAYYNVRVATNRPIGGGFGWYVSCRTVKYTPGDWVYESGPDAYGYTTYRDTPNNWYFDWHYPTCTIVPSAPEGWIWKITNPYDGSTSQPNGEDLDWTIQFINTQVDLKCNDGSGPANSCTTTTNSTLGFSWTTVNATTCATSTGPWESPGTRPTSQPDPPGETSQPITASGTAKLICTGPIDSGSDTVTITRINADPVVSDVSLTIPDYCTVGNGNLGGQIVQWSYSDPDGDPQASFVIKRKRWTGSTWTTDAGAGDKTGTGPQTTYTYGNGNWQEDDENKIYTITIQAYDNQDPAGVSAPGLLANCIGEGCRPPGTCPGTGVSVCWQLPSAYPHPVISSSPAPPLTFPGPPATVDFIGTNPTYSDCYASCPAGGWEWAYGDGGVAQGIKNPTPYTYTASGSYTAALTITDADDHTCSATLPVNIGVTPTPTPALPKWKEVLPQ